MLLIIAVITISFLVGYAMKRGGLCTYAAVLQIVQEKRLERMLVFLGAAAWATLIVIPLYWSLPRQISLTLTHHNLLIALIGGSILGVGAFLNKGCFFGTFVQLVSGNFNYLATLLGLSIGVISTHLYLDNLIPETSHLTDISKLNSTAYIWLFVMGLFALFMFFSTKLSRDNYIKNKAGLCTMSWQNSSAMITIGIGGGLLYATVSGWNYADVLANSTYKLINQEISGPSYTAIISTISMATGGIIAAVTAKEFAIRPARIIVILSCFLGGLLMGLASLIIPGGNDGLLLKGIPGFAIHALVGYAMMVGVMLVLVYLFRRKV